MALNHQLCTAGGTALLVVLCLAYHGCALDSQCVDGLSCVDSTARGSLCEYPCTATLTSTTGEAHTFDFSSGCSESDYEISDKAGHTYNLNICRRANQACLPATWNNTLEFGVAVQRWGESWSCPPKQCVSKATSDPACCTQDCFVVGSVSDAQPAQWSLVDPANITAGVVIDYSAPPTYDATVPWECELDPKTGNQFNRHMVYHVLCDASQATPKFTWLEQDPSFVCTYHVYLDWSEACSST